jgi:hypothetical protein
MAHNKQFAPISLASPLVSYPTYYLEDRWVIRQTIYSQVKLQHQGNSSSLKAFVEPVRERSYAASLRLFASAELTNAHMNPGECVKGGWKPPLTLTQAVKEDEVVS